MMNDSHRTFIQQDGNRTIQEARELAKYVSLTEIFILEYTGKRTVQEKPKKVRVALESRIDVPDIEEKDRLAYLCRFMLEGFDEHENTTVFTINVSFCLKYSTTDEYVPKQIEKDAFGKTNAVFNAWPYLREHVQGVISKMGLPNFVLPTMTIDRLARF